MIADFRLGDRIVRPQRRIIERGAESVHVKPKSMSVLACLAAAAGEPVSRNELFDTVWPGAEVSDDTLTKCVVELRKALGDTARESAVIETIPKLGFRLVLPVEPLEPDPSLPTNSAVAKPEDRRGPWRKLRLVALLLVVLVLGCSVLLALDGPRKWLTETGVTLYMKGSAILVPYSLEQQPGIAVLPFVNMSGDADNEYFSDGMSVEIINALAASNRLPVIARSSSFEFKGRNTNIRDIGRLLGVTHVLEGSVRRAEQHVRVTVQLIDAKTGAHVWSGAYQGELRDIFKLQDEMAKNIVDQIYMVLGTAIAMPADEIAAVGLVTARHTNSLEAYDLYLQGLQKLRSTNPLSIEQASGYFDRAIALDGEYADAWSAKGLSLYVLGRPGFGHPHIPAEVYPGAIAALQKALEIEPEHATAMGWLGVTLIASDYQWAQGMRLMEQSLARNPNDAELLSIYAQHLRSMKIAGADEYLDRAFRLDPFGTVPISIRAGDLIRSGHTLDAAALVETGLMSDREGYAPNFLSALINLFIGRPDAAREGLRKAWQVAHPDDLSLEALGWVLDSRRGARPLPPVTEVMERMKTQRLSFFVRRGMILDWEDAATIVAAFDLAIAQRQPEMRHVLFGPKPPMMPETDWQRMQDATGVTEFQRVSFLPRRDG